MGRGSVPLKIINILVYLFLKVLFICQRKINSSSPPSKPKLNPPIVFLPSINLILPVAQDIQRNYPYLLHLKSHVQSICMQLLLALPLKYLQNLTTSHHLLSHYHQPNHHHLLPRLVQQSQTLALPCLLCSLHILA